VKARRTEQDQSEKKWDGGNERRQVAELASPTLVQSSAKKITKDRC
jgi:hypothetical protein